MKTKSNIISKRISLQVGGDSLISTGYIGDKEFLVCPVVALISNTIVWASDSEHPELVTRSAIQSSIDSWNFTCVVLNHPTDENGEYHETANTPEVIDKFWYGYVFNSRMEKGKLCFDLWLDRERADEVGASDIILRLESGEIVEVSIGASVLVRMEEGKLNGSKYYGVWEYINPDHLATLSDSIGACSVEVGCGAGRRATHKNGGFMKAKPIVVSMNRLMGRLTRRDNRLRVARALEVLDPTESTSYMDLYQKLDKALRKIVPMFGYVLDFYADKGMVLYTTYTENYDRLIWRVGYKVRKGEVVIGEDHIEQEFVGMYKDKLSGSTSQVRATRKPTRRPANMRLVKTAIPNKRTNTNTNTKAPANRTRTRMKVKANRKACDCKKGGSMPIAGKSKTPVRATDIKSRLVRKLVTHPNAPFTKAQKVMLSGFTTPTLKKLVREFCKSGSVNGADSKTGKKVAKPKKLSSDSASTSKVKTAKKKLSTYTAIATTRKPKNDQEWLRDAPISVRKMLKRHEDQEARLRGKLITFLCAHQTQYSQKKLERMETDELIRLDSIIREVGRIDEDMDFTSRGLAVNYSDVEEESDEEDESAVKIEDPWLKNLPTAKEASGGKK